MRSAWVAAWLFCGLSGGFLLFWHSTAVTYFQFIMVHAAAGFIALLVSLFFLFGRYGFQQRNVLNTILITLALLTQFVRVAIPAFDIISLSFSLAVAALLVIREIRIAIKIGKRWLDFSYLIVFFLTMMLFIFVLQMGVNPFSPFFYRFHGYFSVLVIFCGGLTGAVYLWQRGSPFWKHRAVTAGQIAAGLIFLTAGLISSYYKNHVWGDETDLRRPDVYCTYTGVKPSGAKTAGLPKYFVNESAGCRSCHPEISDQWRGSTHRFAVKNLFYQKVVREYVDEFGVERARFCINCHDPATALFGDLDAQYNAADGRMDNDEGVSCKACHIITKVDGRIGNGLIQVRAETPYPGFDDLAEKRKARQYTMAIAADPRAHIRNFRRRPFYQQSEYCISCHLVTMEGEGPDRPPSQLHTLFEQWEKSPWKDQLTCVECHLPTIQMDSNGYPFYDHRIFGSNNALHLLAIDPTPEELELIREMEAMTDRYLRGSLAVDLYSHVYDPRTQAFGRNPAGHINPVMTGSVYGRGRERFDRLQKYMGAGPMIGMTMTTAVSASELTIRLRSSNDRVGHNFPSGPIDVNEGWLALTVHDGNGRLLYRSGYLDERHYLEPNAHHLGCREVLDAEGRPVTHHQFWRIRKVIAPRVFKAKQVLEDEYRVAVPADAALPLKIEAAWRYRRIKQRIADWLFDGDGTTFPVFEINRIEKMVTSLADETPADQ